MTPRPFIANPRAFTLTFPCIGDCRAELTARAPNPFIDCAVDHIRYALNWDKMTATAVVDDAPAAEPIAQESGEPRQ